MAIHTILAMTGPEIKNCAVLPSKIAWMACHFSPNDAGISNLPQGLPESSMVILSDEHPFKDHDPERIIHQLSALKPKEVLLDFQRPPTSQTAALARALVQALPCPVGVPPPYAEGLDCPVFLPPVPPHIPLGDHLLPWQNREIWLETALDASEITVTAQGSSTRNSPFAAPVENPHRDTSLHCHYSIREEPNTLRFYLYRTREDVSDLLNFSNFPNIKYALALFQELG